MFNPKIFGADTTDNAGALTDHRQVTTKGARLYSLTFYNTSASDYYLQVHDSATTPAGGAVPKIQIKIPSDSHGSVDFLDGRIFKSGIFVGASTSNTGYTATGSSDMIIDTNFRASGLGN
jgi:hypothetical protein